ncbi:MAG: S41 family peptidase [Bacteroidales bacterium]|nr:S41 family peptidase [Bacteroidales bacterium]
MKKLSIILTFLLCSITVFAENPLWLRKNSISPDGSKIAFGYKGDIFVVAAEGGMARQLTSNDQYDSNPIWTADGSKLVFMSTREGNQDIYVTSAEGGVPTRLTFFSLNENLVGVQPDGTVLFTADITADPTYGDFPSKGKLFQVSLEGGRPSTRLALPVGLVSVNAAGDMLYENIKGYEDPFRKHHTSSVTRDIWLRKADGKFTKMTDFEGEDRNPVFASDGDTFWFLSERDGTLNIYRSSISNPSKSEQLSYVNGSPVRYLSASRDGRLSYSWKGELYTLDGNGAATKEAFGKNARKVDVQVVADNGQKEAVYTLVSSGITSAAATNGGKELAIVVRGDVYVFSADVNMSRRVTSTPEQERGVSFGEDGRSIYYASERNGNWGIWRTSIKNKDEKYFSFATELVEELVTKPGETCFQPVVSPDGKKLAFLRNRTELVVKDLPDGKEKSLFKDVNYSYQDGDLDFAWSPDSKHILTDWMADGGWNNSDVAVVDVESGEIINLTRSGYSDGSFRWALGGKAITWTSDKAGYRSHGSWGAEKDVYAMFFSGKKYYEFTRSEEYEKIDKFFAEPEKKDAKKEEKDSLKAEKKEAKEPLDFANRDVRIVRLTKYSAPMGDHILSPDGSKLYYVARGPEGSALYCLDVKKGGLKVLSKSTGRFMTSPDGKTGYVVTRSSLSKFDLNTGTSKSISFRGEFTYDPVLERSYIFNHIWKQVSEKFYDPEIHGIDWAGYRDEYAAFLPHIDNNYDFQEMLSEMLGELNGSHTGARYYPSLRYNFGYLGLIYDESWTKDGLKIAEVLPGSPLADIDNEIKAGDVITAIDGQQIKAGEDWLPLFRAKGGRRIAVTVEKKGAKPVTYYMNALSSEKELLYKRWVRQREEMVEKLSGGKVGYVHVKGMNSDSFREVYSKALGRYRSCEALIVDTRHNGGGWLHDDLVTLLGGREYVRFEPRGQYIGHEPFSKWTKPSCVLMGEDNYSDASGFPYAYRALGLGKLIGAPVPGTMTAVWWETQVDETLVFGIPQVGNVAVKENRYLENFQIEPDILVYNDPESVLRGEDRQLEVAVEEMLKEINQIK